MALNVELIISKIKVGAAHIPGGGWHKLAVLALGLIKENHCIIKKKLSTIFIS